MPRTERHLYRGKLMSRTESPRQLLGRYQLDTSLASPGRRPLCSCSLCGIHGVTLVYIPVQPLRQDDDDPSEARKGRHDLQHPRGGADPEHRRLQSVVPLGASRPLRLSRSTHRIAMPYRQSRRTLTLLQAPEIVALYALNVSPSMIRLKIRQDFEKNRNITDLNIINMLLHKNQQEYQETMNCWKQEVSQARAGKHAVGSGGHGGCGRLAERRVPRHCGAADPDARA